MEGRIINFRRSRSRQYNNQVLIYIPGIDSRSKASSLIGKKVVVRISEKVERIGKIIRPHGNKGIVLARFKRGLPGQALLKKCIIK